MYIYFTVTNRNWLIFFSSPWFRGAQYITKEKELLAKNNDIMLEFDAKQKRLEDEILAWKQTSKHLTTQVEAYKVEWKVKH